VRGFAAGGWEGGLVWGRWDGWIVGRKRRRLSIRTGVEADQRSKGGMLTLTIVGFFRKGQAGREMKLYSYTPATGMKVSVENTDVVMYIRGPQGAMAVEVQASFD
jgi:hypothetical protein